MTFYEAALQILKQEGRPLHAREIAEHALRDNLLSHVGKQPEQTMASLLAAMARRSHDRRLVVVEPDTFGLIEWNLPANPEALEESGLPERHDESEPPLRGRERHPRISKENVRVAGRGERRRREEVERKKKRLPPLAELVYDLLDRVGRPAPLFDLVASARERDLLGEDIGSEAVEAVLRAENERRETDGKKTVFDFHDGGFVGLRGRHGAPEEGFDILAAVAAAARDLARAKQPKAAPAVAAAGAPPALRGPVAQAVAEQRQRAIKQLRRRLGELDGPGIEAVAALVLEAMGYRDVRVAKRGKEGALFVGKRRMGLVELRSCIRAIRAGRDLRREDVADLRKEMAAHGAHLSVLLSPADATKEARSEAVQPGVPVVLLLTGDALADQLAEKGIGVVTRTVEVVDFDENAFQELRPKRDEKAAPERREDEEAKGKGEGEERKSRRERDERREERRRAREERRAARAAAKAAAAATEAEGAPAAGRAGEGTPAEGPAVPVAPISPPDEPPCPESVASAGAGEPAAAEGEKLAGEKPAAAEGEKPAGKKPVAAEAEKPAAAESVPAKAEKSSGEKPAVAESVPGKAEKPAGKKPVAAEAEKPADAESVPAEADKPASERPAAAKPVAAESPASEGPKPAAAEAAPAEAAKPGVAEPVRAQGEKPAGAESVPAEGAKPAAAEPAPAEAAKPAVAEPVRAEGAKPAGAESVPAEGAKPAGAESVPAEGAKPAAAEPVPAGGAKPAAAESAPAEGAKPLAAESGPAEGRKPAAAEPVPAEGAKPAAEEPVPVEAAKPAVAEPVPAEGEKAEVVAREDEVRAAEGGRGEAQE